MPLMTVLDREPATYTDDQYVELAVAMEALTSLPEWVTFVNVLSDMLNGVRERGFADREHIDHWAGVVDGLKLAYLTPQDIIKTAKTILERQKKTEGKASAPRRDRPRFVDEPSV